MNLISCEIQSRLGVFCAFMNAAVYEEIHLLFRYL